MKPCPKDRRVTYALITSESIELVTLIFPQHKEGIRQIFGSLDYIEKK
ncbi:MarR family transcriptional regulator [Bacillus anthracis]|nr:MarR family transcriptional regulator [Bacillus cereus]MDO8160762.1 MarR family transcriptional regulator [Bacillus toyonensis]OTW88005.1 MarR family transcriptional regulator [Bacillus thuringiensis serovar cameroun]OTX11737.1 MarR family transcriptional regulator [Bacillus thuringiensis serovar seoulensis]PED51969.1 MarR family transcriptional regulator [Bacillus anthracis]PHA14211.1 MarR family transcriptional regulator [Bacillus sp. AFS051223]